MSGNAVEWYFTHSTTNCTLPVGRLLSLNLGSVAFGSFLNGILFLPELIIDIFNVLQCLNEALRKRTMRVYGRAMPLSVWCHDKFDAEGKRGRVCIHKSNGCTILCLSIVL